MPVLSAEDRAADGPRRLQLSTDQRQMAFFILVGMVKDDGLPRGAFSEVAALFSVKRRTIQRLWENVRENAVSNQLDDNGGNGNRIGGNDEDDDGAGLLEGIIFADKSVFANKASARRGGKYKYPRELIKASAKELRLGQRTSMVRTSVNLGIPRTTLRRVEKEGVFRRHTSVVKPALTEQNKLSRFLYCLESVNLSTVDHTRSGMRFKDDLDVVHVDEKWFLLCKEKQRYVLVADEPDPQRKVKSKNYIAKVMFLSACAKPRFIHHNHQWWDGKIGIWPIGFVGEAARASRNRPAGTPVWQNINMTRDVYREYLMDKVLPAILTEWPPTDFDRRPTIRIQQDGAPAHIKEDDVEWLAALESIELQDKIKVFTQPPNSPDLNFNDLGFFNALQWAYYEKAPNNALEIVEMVKEVFEGFDVDTLRRVWLSHQACMREVIKCLGDNTYKVPHLNKARMLREGNLPAALDIPEDDVPEFGMEILEGMVEDAAMAG